MSTPAFSEATKFTSQGTSEAELKDIDGNNGPISRIWDNKLYLEKHHIPEMFESLMAALMLEKPEDHFEYLDTKLQIIQQVGVQNVNWETFVRELHPHRDPIRQELLGENLGRREDAVLDSLTANMRHNARAEKSEDTDAGKPAREETVKEVERGDGLPSELFHLTESQPE